MIRQAIGSVIGFIQRQKRNYRVGMTRASAAKFLTNLTSQYSAIYTVGLGADTVQLGSLTSIGSAISALISTPVGWLVDRKGIRRFYLLAIALMAGSSLLYGLARDWRFLVAAAIFTSVATRLTGTGCRVISADSVKNRDRVTAQQVCGTMASVAGLLSPLLAAYLVTRFGGMNLEGIRPLYYIQFAGYGLVFIMVALQLREPKRKLLVGSNSRFGFFADFRPLLQKKRGLWRWIVISTVSALPMAMF